jgi:di/tricarboxylate transporter
VSDAGLSALILGITLALFVSERVRHDLVALIALLACVVLGLVAPAQALRGFADPAVIAVAAILVVGRAVELSGIASGIARVAIPAQAPFTVRLTALLAIGALLSAFMNNIAALVITMPVAAEIARAARKPPAATLMPLAFATILGGMTTLIGTPANLILSSVREEELGAPFGFFAMTPVGVAVALAGLAYLALIGWRLLPIRQSIDKTSRAPWRVYELAVPAELAGQSLSALTARLRSTTTRLLALHRDDQRLTVDRTLPLATDDRLLLVSRSNQWRIATQTGLEALFEATGGRDWITARVVVAHGSFLIGEGHEAVATRSAGALGVVAVGPRAARQRVPLARMRIEPGDQLFLRGRAADLAPFLARARLLEVDRVDPVPVAPREAIATLAVFAAAVAAIVLGGLSPAIAFLGAAGLLAAARLIPGDEVYRSIDWSVILLLAAMIPVGQSFETSGAAAIAASAIGNALTGMPLVVVLAAICTLTLLLSIFLNNVATAIIMGPLAIDAARLIDVPADAALLAVLIGVSSDFLTPIGHQNNLLVMSPGGYRFTDYARMGALLVLVVVATASTVLAWSYG